MAIVAAGLALSILMNMFFVFNYPPEGSDRSAQAAGLWYTEPAKLLFERTDRLKTLPLDQRNSELVALFGGSSSRVWSGNSQNSTQFIAILAAALIGLGLGGVGHTAYKAINSG